MSSSKVLITLGIFWVLTIFILGFSAGHKLEVKRLEAEKRALQAENGELEQQIKTEVAR